MSTAIETPTSETGLVVWTEDKLTELAAKAKQLSEQPEIQGNYVSTEFFQLAVLLGEAAKSALKAAMLADKVTTKVALLGVGQKLSGQWLDVMTPVARRQQERERGRKKSQATDAR